MLSSVEVLLQVTVPAAITAGALIWQNRQNSTREDRRRDEDRTEREQDRKHASDEATAQRVADLRERWRDERKEAHAALIAELDNFHELASGIHAHADIIGLPLSEEQRDTYNAEANEAAKAVTQAHATVRIIGSYTSTTSALQAVLAVTRARLNLLLMRDDSALERLEASIDEVRSAVDGYLVDVRADLEVD